MRAPAQRTVGTCAVAVALLSSPSARAAQDDPCQPPSKLSSCIDADNVWPQAAGRDWQLIGPTGTAAAGSVAFGLVGSYILRPIGLRVASADPDGTVVRVVDNSVRATLLTALGVVPRLQVTLALPAILYQDGAGTGGVVGTPAGLPRSAAGDLRFGCALSLLGRPAEHDGPALSGRFELGVPSGDAEAFASAATATFVPGVSFDYRLGRLGLGADAGARVRGTSELAGARIGSQLWAALGAGYDLLDRRRLAVGVEAYALLGLAAQQHRARDPLTLAPVEEPSGTLHAPAEWLLSVRSAALLGGRLTAALSGGSFIPTGSESPVTVPRLRLMAALHYVLDDERSQKTR
ncbi:MAG: hypothetical protein HY744_09920 [Deltaproteobacteria bacterium]|nr:hypothetical protein [Deltaproteobacteria bacterium]